MREQERGEEWKCVFRGEHKPLFIDVGDGSNNHDQLRKSTIDSRCPPWFMESQQRRRNQPLSCSGWCLLWLADEAQNGHVLGSCCRIWRKASRTAPYLSLKFKLFLQYLAFPTLFS